MTPAEGLALREALEAGADRLELARELVAAVAALHAGGAVYGAVGPERVRIAAGKAWLQSPGARGAGGVAGDADAIPYAAPEVLRGARPGRRADIHATAALTAAVLGGGLLAADASAEGIRRALHGVRGVPEGVPAAVARELRRAMAGRWWRRPRTLGALLEALEGEAVVAGVGGGNSTATSTATPPPLERKPRPFTLPRSRLARAALVAAAAAVLATAALGGGPSLARAVQERLARGDAVGAHALLDEAERDGRSGPRIQKLRGDVACARGAQGECLRRYRLALAADPALRDDAVLRQNTRRLLERPDSCGTRRAAADLAGELRDPELLPALRTSRRNAGFLGFLCGGDAVDRAIATTASARAR